MHKPFLVRVHAPESRKRYGEVLLQSTYVFIEKSNSCKDKVGQGRSVIESFRLASLLHARNAAGSSVENQREPER